MEKKATSAVVLALLLIGTTAFALRMQQTANKIWYVGPPPADFASIQEAINNDSVSPGDTIEVMWKATPYHEGVNVTKSLNITRYSSGPPGLFPTVDGGFNVTADGVEINGFNIANGTFHGTYGILLDSSNNIILDNTVTNCYYGIYIAGESANNTLIENAMNGNARNFGVNDRVPYGTNLPVEHFIQDINETNTVDGKPVCYWVDKTGGNIPADAGYVAIVNSTGVTAENLSSLRKNVQGVLVAYSSQITVKDFTCSYPSTSFDNGIALVNVSSSTVQNVTFSDIDNPILLSFSENNLVQNNNVNSTSAHGFLNEGISLEFSDNNTIFGNTVRNDYARETGQGIELAYSTNNTIVGNTMFRTWSCLALESNGSVFFHNNFLSSQEVITAPDSLYNEFDNGYEGNYWSDYSTRYPNATEINGTGIWDSPYVYGLLGAKDNCPLVEEWNSTRLMVATTLFRYAIDLQPNYTVTILSDHVVASYENGFTVMFYDSVGLVTFNVTAGSSGFCNVTIPRNMLDTKFELLIDGPDPIDASNYGFTYNATYSSINFIYDQGVHHITIKGYKVGGIIGDLDGNGKVDMGDIVKALENFGQQFKK